VEGAWRRVGGQVVLAGREEWGRKPDRVHRNVTSLETLAVSEVSSVLQSTSLFSKHTYGKILIYMNIL